VDNWLPPAFANALINLALGETTCVCLVVPDHAPLVDRQAYRCSVEIHDDNLTHLAPRN
jgi:hypothetical protein